MAPKADLILIHPPSVFDFQRRKILFGPISDVVPSSPAFEIYPIGFSSIAEYLSMHGLGVRIVNLAYLMLRYPDMDVRRYLKNLKAGAFGISLHWLPHGHGAVELARILKEVHPDTPVIFGGYSATYFSDEIIRYPYVDFVVRGDSTERALLSLMTAIKGRGDLGDVPNLTYKVGQEIITNEGYIAEDNLNDFSNNYRKLFGMAVKYRDIFGMTPIYDWWRYPITMLVTCRGCKYNCAICGGSRFSGKKFLKRDQVAFRDPELIAKDMLALSKYTRAPIFVVGDIRQAGDEYAEVLVKNIGKKKIKNHVVFELFDMAPEGFFEMLGGSFPNLNFEISPETHDDEIRKKSGKTYSTDMMEKNLGWAIKYGAKKIDVFFMMGIAGQDRKSVIDTVDYSGSLMEGFGKRVVPFISPLAPFLDPGSIAFENPERHGYRVLFRKFSEHLDAQRSPSWKYMLNYETDWLNRDEIVSVTYEAGKRLNELKYKGGYIDKATHDNVRDRITRDIKFIAQIDRMVDADSTSGIEDIVDGFDTEGFGTVCDEKEIKWPVTRSGFRFFNIAASVVSDFIKRLINRRKGF